MEQERQKEILDKAWSYASEDPYNDEEGHQQLSPDFEDEEEDYPAYHVSIQRQLNPQD